MSILAAIVLYELQPRAAHAAVVIQTGFACAENNRGILEDPLLGCAGHGTRSVYSGGVLLEMAKGAGFRHTPTNSLYYHLS